MPRKAPDKVIEHRISLSNFERQQILDQLEKQRDNKLLTAGISQVGAIAGSSLVLYGILAYLGIDLLGRAKDGILDFIDDTSTGLADFVTREFLDGIPPNTAEAEAIRSFYDRIDEAKRYHRQEERLQSIALEAKVRELREGKISIDQFKLDVQPIRDEIASLDQLRVDILQTYNHGRYFIIAQRQYPAWLGFEDWRDVITAGKGWTGP